MRGWSGLATAYARPVFVGRALLSKIERGPSGLLMLRSRMLSRVVVRFVPAASSADVVGSSSLGSLLLCAGEAVAAKHADGVAASEEDQLSAFRRGQDCPSPGIAGPGHLFGLARSEQRSKRWEEVGKHRRRLLETDLRRIQLTIWPFATRCRYRVKASAGRAGGSSPDARRSPDAGRPRLRAGPRRY